MNGPLRIPTSEIEALARLRGWDFEKRNDFLFYVDRLDEAYMAHVARVMAEDERKRQTAQSKPSPKRRRH